MTNQSNTNNPTIDHQTAVKPSALAKFHLSFEYDRSWNEAKQTVQHRPTKK